MRPCTVSTTVDRLIWQHACTVKLSTVAVYKVNAEIENESFCTDEWYLVLVSSASSTACPLRKALHSLLQHFTSGIYWTLLNKSSYKKCHRSRLASTTSIHPRQLHKFTSYTICRIILPTFQISASKPKLKHFLWERGSTKNYAYSSASKHDIQINLCQCFSFCSKDINDTMWSRKLIQQLWTVKLNPM